MNSYLQMWTYSSEIILPDSWGIAPICPLKKKVRFELIMWRIESGARARAANMLYMVALRENLGKST